jgi:hypothetical protein
MAQLQNRRKRGRFSLATTAVHAYLKNLDSLARKLYVNAKKQRTRPSDPDLIDAGQKLFEEFEDLYRRRNEVFKPFLKLDSA